MVGQNIGKYRVIERVGRGGMGTVYLAVDETLHRDVAIKVLNAELNDPEVGKRFRAEAITVARLSHPGIATIYELFQHEGQWLMVMEFVRGETLERTVERAGALPPQRAAELCMQSLAALAHAHSMGVVHRDLKPANIMMTEGGAIKIMDFGIARVAGTEHLTNAGFMMGTPSYMAPEQVMGQEIDARADLYAMGVVFYRLTTGKLPFKGETPFAMAQSQVNDPPTPVGIFRADLPPWVEEVVVKALSKKPEDRFQSAVEFHEAFARCLAGLPMATLYSSSAPTELMMTPPRAMPTGTIRQTLSSMSPSLTPTVATPAGGPGTVSGSFAAPVSGPVATPPSGASGSAPVVDAAALAATPPTIAAPQAVSAATPPIASPQAVSVATPPIASPQAVSAATPPIASPQAVSVATPPAVPSPVGTPAAAPTSQPAATKGQPAARPAASARTPASGSGPGTTAIVAAAVVILTIAAGAWWYRSHRTTPAAAASAAPAAVSDAPQPPLVVLAPAADAASPAPAPESTAPVGPAAAPASVAAPAASAPPAAPPVPAAKTPASASATSAATPSATAAANSDRRAASGDRSSTPAAGSRTGTSSASSSGGTGGATGSSAAAAAADRGTPAVEDTHLAFTDVKVLNVTGHKTNDQDIILSFVGGQISVVDKKTGSAMVTIPYRSIARATYVHSRNPKWDATFDPAPPDNLDVGGMLRTSKHWLVLQSRDAYWIFRLDDSNATRILQTVEARTGVSIDRPSQNDKSSDK